MELRHLRYFLAVAEEENVGRAAERLHVSASPLSRQVHQLESELGVSLFERVGRGMRLTPAGRTFLVRARQVLGDLDRAMKEAQSVGSGALGRLALAFTDTPAFARMMPEVIRRLRVLHPQVALEVVPLSSKLQLEALRAGTIDAGFGHEHPGEPALHAQPLHSERVLLAMPEDHPLTKAKTIRTSMLADQPFVWLRGDKPAVFEALEGSLREKGVTLNVVLEVRSSSETRLSLVASGMGLTFALESSRAELPPRVVLRPVADLRVDGRAWLVWRSSNAQHPLVRSLRSVVQEVRKAASV